MAIKISGTTIIDNTKNIINGVNANYTGIVTATAFVGDGTNITNTPSTGIGVSIYTSPGTFVVGTDCPSNVTTIKISCMGGGGNGGPTPGPGNRGGGGASVLGITTQPVSNGQSYSITVGGAAGISSVTLPTATPIDVILVPAGVSAPGSTGTGAGGAGAPITPAGADYVLVGFNGGNGASPGSGIFYGYPGLGGLGGSSVLGKGGQCLTAAGNGNAATGYGAGGGGSYSPGSTNRTGGAGAPGIVIIEW
jgi:hypothetical protein